MTCAHQLPLSGDKVSHSATYVLALRNGSEVDFYLGLSQNVGGGGHVDKEVCCADSLAVRSSSTAAPYHPQNSQLLVSVSENSISLHSDGFLPRPIEGDVGDLPCTVAFAPSALSAPIVPTMKYWKTLGPVSPPLFLYAANEGILVVSGPPLKGLSNEEAEALRVCMAVHPAARATGNW